MDTIFALCTARGKSGVAVVRVSGPNAFRAAEVLAGDIPEPRTAVLRKLLSQDGSLIDEALVLTFKAGHSFTGEDVVEFQTHGSPIVVRLVLDELAKVDGLRRAEAGEFTRQALQNDRLDLNEIEGLADLIDAQTQVQHQQALRSFSGYTGKKMEDWRRRLLDVLALLTSSIDFSDEEIPDDLLLEVKGRVSSLIEDFRFEIDGISIAERVRSGFRVAIVGIPNVGKSTLLNYLAGREVAITSDIAGTTRDVIEVNLDLNGIPVTLIDTAGLRQAQDDIEKIGVHRSREIASDADLRVHLVEGLDHESGMDFRPGDLVRIAKDNDGLRGGVSGMTGFGVKELLDEIAGVLEERVSRIGVATHARQKDLIRNALDHLESAAKLIDGPENFSELVVEDVQRSITSIDILVGRFDVEEVLGSVFSRFCIGK